MPGAPTDQKLRTCRQMSRERARVQNSQEQQTKTSGPLQQPSQNFEARIGQIQNRQQEEIQGEALTKSASEVLSRENRPTLPKSRTSVKRPRIAGSLDAREQITPFVGIPAVANRVLYRDDKDAVSSAIGFY